ncbi:MAG: superoxide dismutase family protein [Thermotogae bacterium]|nr:superoxide dismutase family protein [Thermotogota bacterium]
MRRILTLIIVAVFLIGATDDSPIMKAKAQLFGFKDKNVRGEVLFYQYDDMRVRVFGKITGLPKNKTFAIHVHQFGDCSSPKAAGGHFDPYHTGRHGNPNDPIGTHHSGDLPNMKSNAKGEAILNFTTKAFTVVPSPYSVLGRSVIIHAGADDYKSQPAGNAGPRVACGIIGIIK